MPTSRASFWPPVTKCWPTCGPARRLAAWPASRVASCRWSETPRSWAATWRRSRHRPSCTRPGTPGPPTTSNPPRTSPRSRPPSASSARPWRRVARASWASAPVSSTRTCHGRGGRTTPAARPASTPSAKLAAFHLGRAATRGSATRFAWARDLPPLLRPGRGSDARPAQRGAALRAGTAIELSGCLQQRDPVRVEDVAAALALFGLDVRRGAVQRRHGRGHHPAGAARGAGAPPGATRAAAVRPPARPARAGLPGRRSAAAAAGAGLAAGLAHGRRGAGVPVLSLGPLSGMLGLGASDVKLPSLDTHDRAGWRSTGRSLAATSIARGVRPPVASLDGRRLVSQVHLHVHLDGPARDPDARGPDSGAGADPRSATGRDRRDRCRPRRVAGVLRESLQGHGPRAGGGGRPICEISHTTAGPSRRIRSGS